jgi:hypothetical protein
MKKTLERSTGNDAGEILGDEQGVCNAAACSLPTLNAKPEVKLAE